MMFIKNGNENYIHKPMRSSKYNRFKLYRRALALIFCFIIFTIFTLCTQGCNIPESWKLDAGQIEEQYVGISYTIDTFSNSGEMTMKTHGERISVTPNKTTVRISSNGETRIEHETSSVITINIDGHEIESCGDTCIFYEDGLEPIKQYEPVYTIDSTNDGSFRETTYVTGIFNQIDNYMGKSRIVVIKSQLGTPIYVFAGDSISYGIDDDLPKFTKLSVDGKLLYIHRANFQIIDTVLLN